MKWIGQHIWDFISRFRNDVYLEDLTESAQDHVVGIDADGKLYKQDVSSGDITGVDISVGTGLDISQSNTTSGDYSSTISLDLTEVGVDGFNNQILTDNGDGTVTSEANAIYGNDALQLLSSVTEKPTITLKNTNTDALGPSIIFQKTATGADDDELGKIVFKGDDDGDNINSFAEIVATINDATDTNEGGGVEIKTMTQGVSRPFVSAAGHGTSTRISVDLAYGLGSITTVAGNFKTLGESVTLSSSTTAKPVVEIMNTNTDGTGPELKLNNTKGGSTDGIDGDFAGKITFNAVDDGTPSTQEYGQINVRAHDVTSTEESGTMSLMVATHNGLTVPGLTLQGGDVSNEVDATIGSGALSSTTIAGMANATTGATMLNDSYLIFSDSDNSHNTRVKSSTTSTNRTILFPDATGTVQLQGENTGQVVHVNIRDNGSYLFYMYNDDYWYSAGSTTLAILGLSSSPGDISSANSEFQGRAACYTAMAACTVKKLTLTFYWTSTVVNSADIDFAFSKSTPITDGTAAIITMNSITATDHDGVYTENKPYQKTFTFSGGNATLAAGDCFHFHVRTTGGQSAQRVIIYGSAVLSLELD